MAEKVAVKSFVFRLDDPDGVVEVGGKTYRNGDEFEIPKGWKYDAEFSKFCKHPSFSYETSRRTRNVRTGAWENTIDVKRESLPVIEA